ncbi:MAG: zf-HC2 domain-containing protein [Candidatus Sulfotelmatobacter sp.]
MDHDRVVRQQMTEKYLLGELDADVRLEFEEHFFDCPDCALDIRAGALFVEQSKLVLAEKSVAVLPGLPAAAPVPARVGWLAWLRPAFAAPVLALLLAVVGYQNLITYPHLRQALHRPQVLPFAVVNVGTWGSGEQTISTRFGEGFLLFVRIPPNGYSSHTAEFYNPAGKLEWSLAIPAVPGQDQWPVQVPGANRESGTYILVVRALTSEGQSKEVGRASFELQVQK